MAAETVPHILVVEDDADFRANMVEWLEECGYAVTEAGNGKQAMDVAAEACFDVVVTDLKMPEANGLELLEWFKATHPDTAVVFLSGQATVQDAIRALREWGGFDFLEKPIEMTALSTVIERAIACRPAAPEPPAPSSAPLSPFAQRTLALIAARYREPIGLADLSRELGYSAAYLTNTLRRETGKTVLQWIIHHRLE
jgi:DNA-binding NtrC family response regulator